MSERRRPPRRGALPHPEGLRSAAPARDDAAATSHTARPSPCIPSTSRCGRRGRRADRPQRIGQDHPAQDARGPPRAEQVRGRDRAGTPVGIARGASGDLVPLGHADVLRRPQRVGTPRVHGSAARRRGLGAARRRTCSGTWVSTSAPTTSRRASAAASDRRRRSRSALVRPFEVLLVDEPFVGLDATGKIALLELLDAVNRDGAALIVATHRARLREPGRPVHRAPRRPVGPRRRHVRARCPRPRLVHRCTSVSRVCSVTPCLSSPQSATPIPGHSSPRSTSTRRGGWEVVSVVESGGHCTRSCAARAQPQQRPPLVPIPPPRSAAGAAAAAPGGSHAHRVRAARVAAAAAAPSNATGRDHPHAGGLVSRSVRPLRDAVLGRPRLDRARLAPGPAVHRSAHRVTGAQRARAPTDERTARADAQVTESPLRHFDRVAVLACR